MTSTEQPWPSADPSRAATAEERLERILYILPAAARKGGAALDELARALTVRPETVLRDIEEVTARAFYHPAGGADDLQILVEGDRVTVFTRKLDRPPRLTAREALALGLGLRMVAAEHDGEAAAGILELARRLEERLTVPPAAQAVHEARPHAPDEPADAEHDDAILEPWEPPPAAVVGPYGVNAQPAGLDMTVAEAARERRRCRIRYLKTGAAEAEERVIRPYVLIHAEGRWYVLAYDESRDDIRIFRVDRILAASLEDGVFDLAAGFDASAYLADGGRVYRADAEETVVVRYSARVARWVAERMTVEERPDGSVVARLTVADRRWLLRHVLQYGPEAEVLEPEAVRAAVLRRVAHLAGPAAAS